MQTYNIDINADKFVPENKLNEIIEDFMQKLKNIKVHANITKEDANAKLVAKKRTELFKQRYFSKISADNLMSDSEYQTARHEKYAK